MFTTKTCFASLNLALEKIYAIKVELLLLLKRPEIPLHNNLSENGITCKDLHFEPLPGCIEKLRNIQGVSSGAGFEERPGERGVLDLLSAADRSSDRQNR
ncbi:MAG: hypothetical protein KGY41_10945 [Desulfovermiculus sp.]|nr:hypothetical protein [Desulfovermiculus sp.]